MMVCRLKFLTGIISDFSDDGTHEQGMDDKSKTNARVINAMK